MDVLCLAFCPSSRLNASHARAILHNPPHAHFNESDTVFYFSNRPDAINGSRVMRRRREHALQVLCEGHCEAP